RRTPSRPIPAPPAAYCASRSRSCSGSSAGKSALRSAASRSDRALLDASAEILARSRHAVDAQAIRDVVENRFRKRVGFLKHHPDAAPQIDDVQGCGVDVAIVDLD